MSKEKNQLPDFEDERGRAQLPAEVDLSPATVEKKAERELARLDKVRQATWEAIKELNATVNNIMLGLYPDYKKLGMKGIKKLTQAIRPVLVKHVCRGEDGISEGTLDVYLSAIRLSIIYKCDVRLCKAAGGPMVRQAALMVHESKETTGTWRQKMERTLKHLLDVGWKQTPKDKKVSITGIGDGMHMQLPRGDDEVGTDNHEVTARELAEQWLTVNAEWAADPLQHGKLFDPNVNDPVVEYVQVLLNKIRGKHKELTTAAEKRQAS